MTRALRLAAGWTIALLITLAVSMAWAAPTVAPEPAAPVSVASATPPTPPSPPAVQYPEDALPRIPLWPPPERFAGSGRPGPYAPLFPAQAAALQVATDEARARFGLEVLAVGVLTGDRAWTGVSGVARDGVTPLDGDSAFGIASITKTFTAALVLQLVEERRFALDDEIAALVPDAGMPAGVTVAQLLSHTSGIADLLAPMRELMNADPDRLWSGADVIGQLGDPWFAPGRGYAYSNSNYVMLGMLVERATGRSFADELQLRLLDPLGLAHTGTLTSAGAPSLMPASWASAFGTAGFMYSSVSDLLAWSDALTGGRVLRPETLARMMTFEEDGYGLGLERIELGDRVGYGHSGLLRGFTSLMVHLPADDVTVVMIGSWQGFDPVSALTYALPDRRSILELALGAAGGEG